MNNFRNEDKRAVEVRNHPITQLRGESAHFLRFRALRSLTHPHIYTQTLQSLFFFSKEVSSSSWGEQLVIEVNVSHMKDLPHECTHFQSKFPTEKSNCTRYADDPNTPGNLQAKLT